MQMTFPFHDTSNASKSVNYVNYFNMSDIKSRRRDLDVLDSFSHSKCLGNYVKGGENATCRPLGETSSGPLPPASDGLSGIEVSE